MSVQFKFKESVSDERRCEIVDALERAGFEASRLFPDQKRPGLASIFTVSEADASDIEAMKTVFAGYRRDIEYVEAAPERHIKGKYG
jgi:hypothetical protein